MTIVIMGGGAAGLFAALAAKEANSHLKIILLEKSGQLLSKVRISGGGRCNVTHSCFDPKQLITNYPRGAKELLGPFTRFQPSDTIEWFESRGVQLKTEADGRMFPITDSSETIIACLLQEAKKKQIEIRLKTGIDSVLKQENSFLLTLSDGSSLTCEALLIASGSHPSGHKLAKQLGHTIHEPVPSLFTLNLPGSPLSILSGVVVDPATVRLAGTDISQTGPLLITHWGLSGPAALKLSAWGARYLKEKNYEVPLLVDWLPKMSEDKLLNAFKEARNQSPSQSISNNNQGKLPKNLWKLFLEQVHLSDKRLSDISNEGLTAICSKMKNDLYQVKGKTTNKEEFVTCGGIALNEVNFKTMESKLCQSLYFAGEVLDVDAVTGGFNFQNAWTTGWIAGNSLAFAT
jgi:predicted Rossmann fold flavoprotein